MKKFQIIFFSVYGVFHLGLVAMTFYIHNLFSDNNLTELLKMAKRVPTMRWLALGGLVIFGLNVLMFVIQKQRYESKIKELENEKNRYKAKMFDMQESSGKSSATSEVSQDEPKSEDSPSSEA